MDEPFVLGDLVRIDSQGIGDRALIDRPERVGIQFEIQNSRFGNPATEEVEQIPDSDIRRIISYGQIRELIGADPYAELPL
jgi:hypothetical protein